MLLVVMALALGYFAFDKFVLAPGRVEVGKEARPPAPVAADPAGSASVATTAQDLPTPADPKSIAVLAIANMSADKDTD